MPRNESPMEDYEHAAMADPFASAVSFFTQLISNLSGPAVLALPHQGRGRDGRGAGPGAGPAAPAGAP